MIVGTALGTQYHVTPARLRDAGLYHCPMSYCSAYKGKDLMIEGLKEQLLKKYQ